MIRHLGCLGLGLALAGAPQSADEPAGPAPVYAALPFRDLSFNPGGAEDLLDLLRRSLEVRGALFVPAEDLERVLRARRIRYTDSVSRADAGAIAELTGADYLIAGALISYEGGGDPRIALALRVIDVSSGLRVGSSLVSLRGEEFEGLLGLGAVTDVRELELEVLARVLEGFAEDGTPAPERGWSDDRGECDRAGSYFMGPDYDPSTVHTVAVLPLSNRTNRPEAGLTFAELLSHHWSRSGIDVVEQSELRAAMISERVRSLDFLDLETLRRIGRVVGARHFVLGSIDRYVEEVFVDDDTFPETEVSIRILDVELGRIVAAAGLRRRGDQYHVILGLGVVRDLISLADRAARDAVLLMRGSP